MKFKNIQSELCLSVQAIALTLGIAYELAVNTVWKGLNRHRDGKSTYWRHYSDELDNRVKWVVYESLPDTTRLRVDYHYGSDLMTCYYKERLPNKAKALVQHDDITWFHSHTNYSDKRCSDLALACGWLRLVSPQGWYKPMFSSKLAAYDMAAQLIAEQQLSGFKISNGRILARKANAWSSKTYQSLVSKRLGNNNARKMVNIQEKRIIDLYASPLKPTITDVWDQVRKESISHGWAQVSRERVRQILFKPKNQPKWVTARHGRNAARSLTETIVKRRRPDYPDQLWSVDGTTVQLYSSQNGKIVKTLYYVEVTDGYSDAVIGYAFGKTETADVILRALRMACQRRGYRPRFLQYDGAAANSSKEVKGLIERLGVHGIKAQPYNGKSKYVERVIGRIEQGVMRYCANFVGGNITTRSFNSKANPDYIKQQWKLGLLPDDDGAIMEQAALCIEIYNQKPNRKGKSPLELYSQADDRREDFKIPYLSVVSAFWVERKKQLRYTPDGIIMEVAGERYFYQVESERGIEDLAFKKAQFQQRFWVRYNPDDLTSINLYDKNRSWVATANQKWEYGSTPDMWEDDEGEKLMKVLKQRSQYLDDGLEEREEIRAEMAGFGLEEASFELLTKDYYNAAQTEVERLLVGDNTDNVLVASKKDKNISPHNPYVSPMDDVLDLLNREDV